MVTKGFKFLVIKEKQPAFLSHDPDAPAAGLADRDAAHIGFVDKTDGVFSTSAHNQTTCNGNIVENHITISHAIADDEVSADGQPFKRYAGNIDNNIAGCGFGISTGSGDVTAHNVIHDLGEFLAADGVGRYSLSPPPDHPPEA